MTDRYVLFGNPVSHSKSPMIHMAFAAQFGEDMEYGLIEAEPGGFADALARFVASGGKGANITTPFKLDAAAAADELREAAALAGAANCLKFEAGRVIAENFDGVGVVRDIEVNQGVPLAGKRVLMLGAGGAARGAALPILMAGPTEFVLANRSPDKAHAIARELAHKGAITACSFGDVSGKFDVVINATSTGLTGAAPDISGTAFDGATLAYEMTYGRGMTPFLRLAAAGGATRLADGVGMLVEQAAEAFAWWRGKRPATGDLIAELTVPLA